MGQSPNRYLDEPRLYTLSTKVAACEALQDGGWAVAGTETIFRPEGGGQPRDHGTVEFHGATYRVSDIHKENGRTFVHLPDLGDQPERGQSINMMVNANRRDRLSRLHTLQHLFSSTTYRVLPKAEILDTGIHEDASSGWITLAGGISAEQDWCEIDRRVRSTVLADVPVRTRKMKSIEQCKWDYGSIFRHDSSAVLSGKVRVVIIEGIDANCCSGTHWCTSNVGPYEMQASPQDKAGLPVRLDFHLRNTWMYWYGP